MSLLRTALLAGSRSAWLRDHAIQYAFVRRSVARFMPGERLEDALEAAIGLRRQGIPAIFTRLGENITSREEADLTMAHYIEAMDAIAHQGLDTQISIKPTQLGLDQGAHACFERLRRLVEKAARRSNFVWIDMESSGYVDRTLELYRKLRTEHRQVGICLQAYLRRTAEDLEALLPVGPQIRLVKGAYLEPPSLAFPDKHAVDVSFYDLAVRALTVEPRPLGTRLAIATHDRTLVARLQAVARRERLDARHYEFEMLFGVQRPLQARLAAEGWPLRVLVSYGESWFSWYMRRLAERPANVFFVLKSLVHG
jgi:proline dehydrogenase